MPDLQGKKENMTADELAEKGEQEIAHQVLVTSVAECMLKGDRKASFFIPVTLASV
jgi:hypothetical protein